MGLTIADGEPIDQSSPGSGAGGNIISTVIGAGAAIYNTEQQKKMAREQNRANRELAEYQYSQDLAAWNRQNEYNSPLSQMQRYNAAGLNPNLIYGSGQGASSGNASQLAKYNAPTMQSEFAPLDLTNVIGQYQDFRMKQAQINNVDATTKNIEARTASEALRPALLSTQGQRAKSELEQYDYTRPYQAAVIGNQARSSEAKLQQEWQRVKNMGQQEQIMLGTQNLQKANLNNAQVQNEILQAKRLFETYKNQWMAQGITSGDNMFLRILVRQWNELGLGSYMPSLNQQKR